MFSLSMHVLVVAVTAIALRARQLRGYRAKVQLHLRHRVRWTPDRSHVLISGIAHVNNFGRNENPVFDISVSVVDRRWEGLRCDTDVNECEPSPCLNGGRLARLYLHTYEVSPTLARLAAANDLLVFLSQDCKCNH